MDLNVAVAVVVPMCVWMRIWIVEFVVVWVKDQIQIAWNAIYEFIAGIQ